MLRDSFMTKSWKDKFRVWFSDSRWRPEDVSLKYPALKMIYHVRKIRSKVRSLAENLCFFQIFGLIIIPNFIVSGLDHKLTIKQSCLFLMLCFYNLHFDVLRRKRICIMARIFQINIFWSSNLLWRNGFESYFCASIRNACSYVSSVHNDSSAYQND